MLTKKFAGQADTTTGAINPDDDAAVLSRSAEILNALVYFNSAHKDVPAIQAIIQRVVGFIAPDSKSMNTGWDFQRRQLLTHKIESLMNLDEVMGVFRAHAESTYIKPGTDAREPLHGISLRTRLATSCEAVRKAALAAVAEARRIKLVSNNRAAELNERLIMNAHATASCVEDTPAEYARVCQHFSLIYPMAAAAVFRLAELDLAYISANVLHFDRLRKIHLKSSFEEVRDIVSVESVLKLKAESEEKTVFKHTPDGKAPNQNVRFWPVSRKIIRDRKGGPVLH